MMQWNNYMLPASVIKPPNVCSKNNTPIIHNENSSEVARHGLSPPPQMLRVPPNAKQTGQYSGSNCAEIFKWWLFLQSKSVNNVCKLFQRLLTKSPRLPKLRPWTPLGDFRLQTPGLEPPKWKFLASPLGKQIGKLSLIGENKILNAKY